jgi:anti-sigma regulatory factor (Ser/Thr protein kinase)
MSDDLSPSSGTGFVHEALMYRSERELRDALHALLRDAAAAREPVLVVLPRPHLDRFRDTLDDTGAEVRFEDMEAVGHNPNCLLETVAEWVEGHGGRARVISEALWPGRTYPETVECLRHEALVNHALAGTGATVISTYDAEHLDAQTLAAAEMTHPTVREDGKARRSASYGDPLDTLAMQLIDEWPMESPSEPVSEHPFTGSLRELRRDIAGDPLVGRLSSRRRSDLVFAINEAATNAVRHGDGACTTRIWHDGRSVVSEVTFDGSLDDLLAGRRRPQADATAGRGLWLINQVCDLVQLRSDRSGTTLRMHVRDD